jgi:hypothetical protein
LSSFLFFCFCRKHLFLSFAWAHPKYFAHFPLAIHVMCIVLRYANNKLAISFLCFAFAEVENKNTKPPFALSIQNHVLQVNN